MTRYTAFRCREDLLEKVKARAFCDLRSLSNYIIMLIARDVDGAQAARNAAKLKRARRKSKPARNTRSAKK